MYQFWQTLLGVRLWMASGIQNSQNVTAIFNTKKGHIEAYILSIGVSRWSLPFPLGEGSGEGPAVDVVVASCGRCCGKLWTLLWPAVDVVVASCGQCCGQLGMELMPLSYSVISVLLPPTLLSPSPFHSLSIFLLLSIFSHASLDLRTCLSTFKNMPFLRIEGAFLVSRGASSSILSVIVWFLVSYMLISSR